MRLRLLVGLLCVSCVFAHINDYITIPGLKVPTEYHTRVLIVDTFTDFLWANLYIGYIKLFENRIFYAFVYLGIGGALEYTNPAPKTE